MGRELRRKQAKKERKSLKREIQNETHQVKKLIVITVVLVLIIGLIYLLSALFVTKELDWFGVNEEETPETLVEKTILASETFKQKEEEYYVYFYDYDEEDTSVSNAINSIFDLIVYKVDIGSALNNNYVAEESNRNAKNLEELKVKKDTSTLIKISGDTINTYYENEEITTALKK